jgi:hypothetical protein
MTDMTVIASVMLYTRIAICSHPIYISTTFFSAVGPVRAVGKLVGQ